MNSQKEILKRIILKHGSIIDLKKNPQIIEEILLDLKLDQELGALKDDKKDLSNPFGVSWMDSWAALWVLNQKNNNPSSPKSEFNGIINQLVDLKFRERLDEISKFIRGGSPYGVTDEPGPPDGGGTGGGPKSFFNDVPDGGPPEPGVPPAGPSSFMVVPPDGGTPEPGVPPAPQPPGPEPEPDPQGGFMHENPWVLYWFVSIKAPLILEMIDAHFTRRITDIKNQQSHK